LLLPTNVTTLDPHPKRRYLLRFGAENGLVPRVEVRDARFELIGNCDLHDHLSINRLLGTTRLTTKLQKTIAALPLGRIISIEI